MKICMWLGYTPQINFCHFFCNLNLVIFRTFSQLETDVPVGGIVFHKHIFNCFYFGVGISFLIIAYLYLILLYKCLNGKRGK